MSLGESVRMMGASGVTIRVSTNKRLYLESLEDFAPGFSRSLNPMLTLRVIPARRTRVFLALRRVAESRNSIPIPLPKLRTNLGSSSGILARTWPIAAV